MEAMSKKPTSIIVIAWIFIVVAVHLIFSGAMGLVTLVVIGPEQPGALPPIPENMSPFIKGVLNLYNENFSVLTVLQISFAVLMLIAAVYFLKLRSWARTILEIISYIGLIYVVVVQVFYIGSWRSLANAPEVQAINSSPLVLMILGAILGMAIWCFFFVVVIRCLRGNVIREAVQKY